MEQSKKTEYRMEIEDQQIANHTYAEEQILWDRVRLGDVDGLKKILESRSLSYPIVIKTNPMKSEEYMAVSVVTILARIAIESGITSKESFLVSDLYLRRISLCKTVEEVRSISDDAMITYTKMIKKYMNSRSMNMYVEDCKRAILNNIFKKISLSTLSETIGVESTYLSRLFKKYEGMTMTDYINQQKVEVSQNMLKYSDRSISEISAYLGFSSQSYFGKLFKELTGMTPLTFRIKYHPPEF